MARSTYIYIVMKYDEIFSAHTVKYEAQALIREAFKNQELFVENTTVLRVRDNRYVGQLKDYIDVEEFLE